MAEKKIIEIGVKTNIPEVTQDFKNLNDQIQQTNAGIDSIQSSVEDSATNINKVTKATDNHSNAVKKNTQGVLDNGGAVGILNELTGGLASTVKDAAESTSLFSKEGIIGAQVQKAYALVVGTSTGAMKGFRIALAATGVGLLVIGLGLLIANFDKVKETVQSGIDKFKGLGEGTKTLISVLFPLIGVVRLVTLGLEKMGIIDDDITAKQKENAKQKVISLNKERTSIEDKYNQEIRLAQAAGKDTVKLEQLKRDAILKTLYALNTAERARIKSGDATQEEIKNWNLRQKEIKKTIEDGEVAKVAAIKASNDKQKEIRDKGRQTEKEENKKAYDDNKKDLDDKLSQEGLSFKERRDLIAADRALTKEDRKKYNAAVAKDEEKERQEAEKKRLDADMESANKAIDILNSLRDNTETPAQKEEREYQEKKAVLEANNLSTEELTKQHLAKLNQIDNDARAKDADDAKATGEKKAADEAKIEQDKNNVIASSKENLTNIIQGLETTGLAKSKAGQAVAKTIALTQIGIDSAVAISKASTLANAEGAAATLAFPMVPGIGTIARVLSYTSTVMSVASNIAKAKQLLSSGGGGNVSGGSGGGTPPSAPSAPAVPTSVPVADLSKQNDMNNISAAKNVSVQPVQQITVKAVVSETELTKTQQTIANIKSNSEL